MVSFIPEKSYEYIIKYERNDIQKFMGMTPFFVGSKEYVLTIAAYTIVLEA